ncbi:thioredoxin reductase [Candidatus Phycorickettsia trachydisci]|uniref:Thioredoxin reductase n=1 Tax=Candidatus Phycorickettsia trachydisci TaxID=2115978 RepID=A0A2P1P861_9RICK|nr:thioredoxin-disulfide reductase [Candidatus Phycorickettsia trachydisci]AVP87435.1 thioredoxin reductase [Candidatus Phycorickettsia trachydisci]
MIHKVLIIGSGPAGCTAAIYAARANLEPTMICGFEAGGQLTTTTDVENFPGFEDPVQGPILMQKMMEQSKKVGTRIIHDEVIKVDFDKKPFSVYTAKEEYLAHSIIIATGASAKWLGLESEQEFRGFGVSACATCDGFFFKNKHVLVVGGGNSAVEEALYLTHHASKVTLIHRRDSLRAEKILQDRLFKNPKIDVIWNSELAEVLGTKEPIKSVIGAKIKNTQTNQIMQLDIDGIFIAIGHKPNTDLFKDFLEIDSAGYIKTKPGTVSTNIEGVFAAGDVQDKIYRQAVTAAGTGCMAALDAERYLSNL